MRNITLIMNCGWLIATGIMLTTPVMADDIRYVTDTVRLKMYSDQSLSTLLKTLQSGDRVVVLKIDDNYSQVKIDSGQSGWVKSAYLVEEKPAAVRVRELEKQLSDLRQAHTDLLTEQPLEQQKNDAELRKRLSQAEAKNEKVEKQLTKLVEERTHLVDELRESSRRLNQRNEEESRQLLIWLVVPILALLSGFFLGVKYLEKKIRARFGGYNPL